MNNTRTARSAKRTKADDDWAAKISGGRYTTLRRLMTAIHNGEIVAQVKQRETEAPCPHLPAEFDYICARCFTIVKKGKQS